MYCHAIVFLSLDSFFRSNLIIIYILIIFTTIKILSCILLSHFLISNFELYIYMYTYDLFSVFCCNFKLLIMTTCSPLLHNDCIIGTLSLLNLFCLEAVLLSTVISWLSSHPFRFASQLSSQKFLKKSRFNFYKNLLIFTANQASHKNVRDLNKS